MNAQVCGPTLSIHNVQNAFVQWRAHRTKRVPIPQQLRRQAVALLAHHRANHVCAALGINAQALKQWSQADRKVVDFSSEANPRIPAFIAPPDPQVTGGSNDNGPTVSELQIELPNGVQLRTVVDCRLSELLGTVAPLAADRRLGQHS